MTNCTRNDTCVLTIVIVLKQVTIIILNIFHNFSDISMFCKTWISVVYF